MVSYRAVEYLKILNTNENIVEVDCFKPSMNGNKCGETEKILAYYKSKQI